MSPRLLGRALRWAPPLLMGVYLLVVLASAGEIRESLSSHADFASAPVLAELITRAPAGATTLLGDYRWYEALWLLRGTSWLPAHHAVWELVPFALWLGAALLAGLIARRLTGSRWAALVAAALLVCGGVGWRNTLWSLNTHGPAVFHVLLLGYALLVAVRPPGWLRGWRCWAGALLIGAITAVGATDPLVLGAGVAPLLLAAFALWARGGGPRVLGLAALVAAIAAGGAHRLDRLAVGAGIGWTEKPIAFVGPDGVLGKLGLLPGAVTGLVADEPFGQPVDGYGAVQLLAGITALAVIAGALWLVGGELRRALRPAGPGAGPPREVPHDDASVAGLLFLGAVLTATLGAWLFTTAAIDIAGARYLASGWAAAAILLPVLGVRAAARVAAGGAATLLTGAATWALITAPGPLAGQGLPSRPAADAIAAFAAQHGVAKAYAGFWDAAPITWHTRFALEVYPVYACPDDGERNCRFYQHNISSWYAPAAGRSMLIVSRSGRSVQPLVRAVDGPPAAHARIDQFDVYVYDHDIARDLR